MEEEVLLVSTEQSVREFDSGLSVCVDSSCTRVTNHSLYYYVTTGVNFGIFCLFIIGTIIGIWLICRKHKGEIGLWRKIVKRELVFAFIMFALWIIASFIIWYMGGIGVSGMTSAV